MTAGSEEAEWERKRSLDQEAELQLQKRIKDRVPQRRARGKAKAGDIDGMCTSFFFSFFFFPFCLRTRYGLHSASAF